MVLGIWLLFVVLLASSKFVTIIYILYIVIALHIEDIVVQLKQVLLKA